LLAQPLWKSLWKLLKKLKIKLPHDLAVLLLDIYPKECKSAHSRDTGTPMFIAALLKYLNCGINPGAHQPMRG
jgi:hypothetical protein